MRKFDRELQFIILNAAIDAYPYPTRLSNFIGFETARFDAEEEHKLKVNIAYLIEHGVIETEFGRRHASIPIFELLCSIQATKKGIDFMANDGGLSAILNVTTIKFHHDAIQEIANLIEKTVQDPEDKQKFLTQLKQLPYETTKHISLELVSKGLTQIPDVVRWLGTYLS
ncbi:MAG: hypothetical protein KA732_19915 [Providencia sp.]|uniref:hypothetical protein n=1 Tax=Providencia sp. TaxID=589 RepID=UPI001B444F82|nr:hypothetical protein [Providencia sp.]